MSKSSKIVATKYNTIDKNIIGASKSELIIQYYDSNIWLFAIAPCKVITLNLLCFIIGIISLLLFLIAFFEVKALLFI